MKKIFLLGLLGLAVTAGKALGQGSIDLDNYNTSGPYVTYGQSGIPLNGQSGVNGSAGQKIAGNSAGISPWTVGLYYIVGNVTIGADPNPTPIGDPSTFSGGLTLGTGAGTTAGIEDIRTASLPGAFLAGTVFLVPGTSSAGGDTITLELLAFSGATYDSSLYRGHSAAFTIVTTSSGSPSPALVGLAMPAFSVFIVPEPSALALFGVGGAALVLFRRKKA